VKSYGNLKLQSFNSGSCYSYTNDNHVRLTDTLEMQSTTFSKWKIMKTTS